MFTDCRAPTILRETFSTGDSVTDWPWNCYRQDHDEQIKWNTTGDIYYMSLSNTHALTQTHTNTLTCSIAHPLTQAYTHPPVAQMHTVS